MVKSADGSELSFLPVSMEPAPALGGSEHCPFLEGHLSLQGATALMAGGHHTMGQPARLAAQQRIWEKNPFVAQSD